MWVKYNVVKRVGSSYIVSFWATPRTLTVYPSKVILYILVLNIYTLVTEFKKYWHASFRGNMFIIMHQSFAIWAPPGLCSWGIDFSSGKFQCMPITGGKIFWTNPWYRQCHCRKNLTVLTSTKYGKWYLVQKRILAVIGQNTAILTAWKRKKETQTEIRKVHKSMVILGHIWINCSFSVLLLVTQEAGVMFTSNEWLVLMLLRNQSKFSLRQDFVNFSTSH